MGNAPITRLAPPRVRTIADEIGPFEDHLRAAGKSPRTIESYGESVRQLVEFLVRDGRPLAASALTRRDLDAWLNDYADRGRSPATRALRYRSVRVFFGWLVDEGEIDANPMVGMKPPAVTTVPVPALSDADIRRMLDQCKGKTFEDRRNRALLLMYWDTGARLSEIANLRLADLNLAGNVAVIVRKGGDTRLLALTPPVKEALNQYINRARWEHPWRDLPDLWLGRRGRLETRGVVQALRALARDAGVEGFHVHQLRHTYATNFLDDGGAEHELISNMGWSPRTGREMASRYTASNADERARAAALRLSRASRVLGSKR